MWIFFCEISSSARGTFLHFLFLDGVATPTGVFLDSSLNIYVAEYGSFRVTKWTPGNTTAGAVVAGGNGLSNNLNSFETSGIYVGLLGEIYVPDLGKLSCMPQSEWLPFFLYKKLLITVDWPSETFRD